LLLVAVRELMETLKLVLVVVELVVIELQQDFP
jgi:hypothetical protein